MNTCLRKLVIIWLTLFAITSLVSAANISLTTSDPASSSSLTTAGKWSNAQAPSAANDYFTANFFLRTPADAGGITTTFAGHSLTLQSPAGGARSVIFKGGNNDIIVINNLTNALGGILENGGSGNVTVTYTGNLFTIAANSAVDANQGPMIIGYPLSGADGVVLTNAGGNATGITYNNNNSAFTGKFYASTANFGNGGGNTTIVLGAANSAPGNPATFTPDQIRLDGGCTLRDNFGLTLNNANGGITLGGNANIYAAATTVIAEPITGAFTLTANGVGTLVLSSANNNYSGGTTISAGILQQGVANAIPGNTVAGDVTVNSTLNLNGFNATLNGLNGSGTVDTLAGGTPTLTVGANGDNGTFSGTIQNSAGTLSLTKVGAGTETFSGGYTYSGQTLVAGGTLSLNSALGVPSSPGNLVISNGAVLAANAASGIPIPANNVEVGTNSTLSITINSAATALNAAGNLTFQDNATNTFNFGTLTANPSVLAINAAGGISAPGANIVFNLTGIGFKSGTFALIKYTGTPLANVANFSLNLPPGVAGILVNNPGNNSIDVQITSIPSQLAWNGVNGTSWDLATANWTNLTSGNIVAFQQYTNGSVIAGDSVLLDDTVTNDFVNPQPTNINLTVQLFAFPFLANSTLPYSISGAGGILGATSLVKSNTGSLTLNTSNSFTGGTFVYGGTLAINNDSALGATSTLLTLNGGNLQITGNSTNNVRPISMPVATSVGVSAGATARLGGAITGAGTLSKIDNGTLVLAANEKFTGNLFVKSGAVVIDSGGALTNNSGGTWYSIGQSGNDTGTLTLKGTGSLANTYDFNVGDIDNSAGVLNVQDSATLTINNFFVASANNASSTASGIVNQTGGSIVQSNTAVGTFVIGGRNAASALSVGVYNLSGGTLTANAGIRVGSYGTGTLNQNGGTINARGGINIARLAGSFGTNNLNAGLLSTLNVTSSTGVNAIFNFNGGILQANFTPGNPFMAGLSQANVLAGGAIIDSSNNTVVISQPLLAGSANGGLTKLGTGSLTLSGNNTFTGPITNKAGTLILSGASTYPSTAQVNAGTLGITTASTITGATVVANGATFSITQIGSATSSLGNLTFNGGASGNGATLGLTMATANNPAVPLVNCNTLTLNGTNTISLAAVNVGTMALVKYVGTMGGAGNITNLTLPQGATGYVSNNVANTTLYAVITSTGPGLVWTGTNSVSPNLWDISSTTNWLVNSTPTSYHQIITPGDAVIFNDIGSGTVTLNIGAAPASMVISNNTKTYTFTGSGTISGSTGLQKLGANTAILNLTNNSYLGDTIISNGTVQLGSVSAIPPSGNVVLGPTGTLQLAGLSPTLGELTGAGTVDNNNGNAPAISLGGSGGTWTGTITNTGGGGVLVHRTGGTWIVGGKNYLNNGQPFGQQDTISGTVVITNSGLFSISDLELRIASGTGQTGAVVVAGGTLNVALNVLSVGYGDATASGTLTVNSGTVVHGGPAAGVFAAVANSIDVGAQGATGLMTVNGGQVLNPLPLYLGDGATANGTLQLNGGLVQASQVLPNATPLSSVIYFNGGTLQATTNSADFILSTPMVQTGGAVLDDGGFAVTLLTQGLLEDPSSTGGGLIKKGAGTLYLDSFQSYTGTTTVTNGTLAGIGYITGPLLVAPAGTLGAGDAPNVGSITTANNLTLQGKVSMRIDKTTGITSQDSITVGGNVNYGGVLTITNITSDANTLTTSDTFQLFNVTGSKVNNFSGIVGSPGAGLAYSFNPANGLLSIITQTIATNPTNITASVVGSTLKLSWPADHLGWTLQTNSVALTATTQWYPYPGSAAVTNVDITLDKTQGNVFFRLVNP